MDYCFSFKGLRWIGLRVERIVLIQECHCLDLPMVRRILNWLEAFVLWGYQFL